MQTFLPYRDFSESARVLDRQRLGKQRVECLQIMKALKDPDYGWQHHPAVTMWRGYECALMRYAQTMCREWAARGYKDTCFAKIFALVDLTDIMLDPPWLGDAALHASHRSNLLRKNPEHYIQFDWDEPSTLPYVWPV